MKRYSWQILQGILLLGLSLFFYSLHYFIFRDLHHLFIYLIGDVAFVFIEVLLVTVIIHRLLQERERHAHLQKLNMVIGAFISEVGSDLLHLLSRWDPQIEGIQSELVVDEEPAASRFENLCRRLRRHDFDIESEKQDWDGLKTFLVLRRDFLLGLLQNPALIEHESFTEVLWAIFHLTEELEARESLHNLPKADYGHLRGDMKRVYGKLTLQWLTYMEHQKLNYSYLFSLSLRTNPFDPNTTPIINDSPQQ